MRFSPLHVRDPVGAMGDQLPAEAFADVDAAMNRAVEVEHQIAGLGGDDLRKELLWRERLLVNRELVDDSRVVFSGHGATSLRLLRS